VAVVKPSPCNTLSVSGLIAFMSSKRRGPAMMATRTYRQACGCTASR
jgi:hypothetical protein